MVDANRDKIADALALAIRGLQPFVTKVLAPLIPEGTSWVSLLEARDSAAGIKNKTYGRNDLQAMLRVITERMGAIGFPFSAALPRLGQNLASELREVRNRWAHHEDFSDEDTYRAIDTVERLLRMVEAGSEADEAAALKGLAPATPAPTSTAAAGIVNEPETVVEIGGDHFGVELDLVPVLSYAAAHNKLPVVNSITISNTGRARRGAVLSLEASSALGVLSLPSEHLVDLDAGSTFVLTNAALFLDPAHMLRVEEARPASITATLVHDDVVLARARADVELLAAHQWVCQPMHLATELLAAHVQPNHPAIAELLSEASDWLEANTGSGSIEGYQSDENRVDLIANAIFAAMKSREIRYSNPPASWGDLGQKVRNPDEVLNGRTGTCLDTTVVFAAALEQAGIYPLLWLLEGHAFVGYWRLESSLGTAASSEPLEAINLVDLDYIAVVETTMTTTAHPEATFEDARRAPIVGRLQGRPNDITGITDVVEARKARIIPLPARTANDDGTVMVTEYRPATPTSMFSTEYAKSNGAGREATHVPYRVAQWKNSLLDLTLRNRLINFGERGRLSLAIPEGDVGYAEDIINDNKGITLLPSDQIPEVVRARGVRYGRDLSEADRSGLLREKLSTFVEVTDASYTSRLRNLAYKAKTIEEETGANNLYLAFGTLVWTFNSRELRSPLILVPVRLQTGRASKYRIVLDESGGSTPNYCLLEKLRQTHGLRIPALAEPAEDASGIDLDAAFRAMREALEKAGLPYRVESTVDLSILQFAKFRLWKDLDESWEQFAANPLVSHLIESPTSPFADPVPVQTDVDLDSLIPQVPVPADSSQLAAVAAAVAGRTFVLEGPPGTGKSQTITNLLVRAVAEGKKVLFVAEKKAALQVVQRRLDEVGLGAFALDLHDKGSRPSAVRAQIKAALQHRIATDQDGLRASVDVLDSSRRTLDRYAQRLHEPNAAGLSYYIARTRLLAAAEDLPDVAVSRDLVTVHAGRIEDLRDLLRRLPDVAEPARPSPDHPWGFIMKSDGIDAADILKLALKIDSSITAVESKPHVLDVLVQAPSTGAIQILSDLMLAPSFPLSSIDAAAKAGWKKRASKALKTHAALVEKIRGNFAHVDPTILELDLEQVHLDALAADASRFFGRKKRRIAVRNQVAPFLTEASIPRPKHVSAFTAELARVAGDLAESRHELNSVPGLEKSSPKNPWKAFVAGEVATKIDWLETLASSIASAQAEKQPFALSLRNLYTNAQMEPALSGSLGELAQTWTALGECAGSTPESLQVWCGTQNPAMRWMSTRARRDLFQSGPSGLTRWIELLAYVEPLRFGLPNLRLEILSGAIEPEVALPAFDRGVARASLEERASATTLDDFVAVAHDKTVGRYVESSDDVRQRLVTAIPGELLNRRSFDAVSISGQVGTLKRQLDRQRGGLGVRALLDQFGSLISEILPCVLMSPESVARFYPARSNLFDIVVFDEASQVRVADSIGAMGRARSVVVVGDSKQMPPTSFAEPSTSDDEVAREPGSVQDEESILSECVAALVPSLALTWHYRSQDESLIQFSNQQYYGNLSSFPSPLHGSHDDGLEGHGISLVRLNGKFLRNASGRDLRTNPVEAAAIVNEIQQRFWASPDTYPSLGVVTFNAQQRSLIESLLRDLEDERITGALEIPDEGLFVKNLENVQGDERDTILFSTAFSANDNGVLPLNFGPVSQAGGERRLNVAITRARRQVILFSSFDPSELRAEQTSSVGLKHLKAYLELAAGRSAASDRRSVFETVDRHREEIASKLRMRGLSVTTDVGLSDFKVDLSISLAEDPDAAVLAILLDSPAWAGRATVADRDGIPTSVLRNLMKWPGVARVWMPQWLSDPEGVVDTLVDDFQRASDRLSLSKLEVSVREPVEPVAFANVARISPVTSTLGSEAQASPSAPAAQREFEPWPVRLVGRIGTLDALPGHSAAATVQAVVREIVAAEGPIHVVRLAKLTASAFGLERVAQSRMQSIVRCIPSDLVSKHEKTYLWPLDTEPESWTLFRRTAPGADRPLEHVHPREIVNAMTALCIRGAGLLEDELRRETLNVFGFIRMTPNMTSLLDGALKLGLDTGRLERNETGLIIAAV